MELCSRGVGEEAAPADVTASRLVIDLGKQIVGKGDHHFGHTSIIAVEYIPASASFLDRPSDRQQQGVHQLLVGIDAE